MISSKSHLSVHSPHPLSECKKCASDEMVSTPCSSSADTVCVQCSLYGRNPNDGETCGTCKVGTFLFSPQWPLCLGPAFTFSGGPLQHCQRKPHRVHRFLFKFATGCTGIISWVTFVFVILIQYPALLACVKPSFNLYVSTLCTLVSQGMATTILMASFLYYSTT